MKRSRFLPLLFLLVSGAVHAQIEKTATLTDSGIELEWWPKVQPPRGWHFDEGSSHHYHINAMAPDGSTFPDAETVMYAKAEYKPRVPETRSLAQLVKQDISDFRSSHPGMEVKVDAPVLTADHRRLQVMTFAPPAGSTWERVAYGETAEFYVIFAVSSRTERGLDLAMPAFRSLVASYRAGP